MAVREFQDESGRRWRAWSVTPASLHPATKIEEYVDDIYHTGWLVFETVAGDEKRRLSRYPPRWAEASEIQLRGLLARAEWVRGGAGRSEPERSMRDEGAAGSPSQGDVASPEPSVNAPAQQLVRTFRYPGGRYWTASVVVRADEGGRPALRFTAGARIIELPTWPKDWADHTDEQLVELLRRAAPRLVAGAPPPGTPRRRWDDRPELGQ
jgi:hypothetical protein